MISMVDVAVMTGERCLDTVYRALDAIPFVNALDDWERVLIKVNLITSDPWDTGVTTDPIVIPLSAAVTGMNNYSSADTHLILIGVVSSVLAGCVWGDHCSPISDTTILSSMASGCDHVDHVRTQLTYAITVAIVTMLIGDILTAFGLSPVIALLLIAAILIGIIYLIGKKVDFIL